MTASVAAGKAEPSRASDLALAQRAASGDTRAFEVIMRTYNRALFRAARSIMQNDAEAEEAVQEAYVRAYHALAGFRADSSLRTWLTRIVINQALEWLRKRRREIETSPVENIINLETRLQAAQIEQSFAETPERAAIREQTRQLLERKIDELPAAFRTVFVMRAIEEMSVEETAQCLGIPQATVRTRFLRARRLLRKSLAADAELALKDAFSFAGERCDRIVKAVLQRLGA